MDAYQIGLELAVPAAEGRYFSRMAETAFELQRRGLAAISAGGTRFGVVTQGVGRHREAAPAGQHYQRINPRTTDGQTRSVPREEPASYSIAGLAKQAKTNVPPVAMLARGLVQGNGQCRGFLADGKNPPKANVQADRRLPTADAGQERPHFKVTAPRRDLPGPTALAADLVTGKSTLLDAPAFQLASTSYPDRPATFVSPVSRVWPRVRPQTASDPSSTGYLARPQSRREDVSQRRAPDAAQIAGHTAEQAARGKNTSQQFAPNGNALTYSVPVQPIRDREFAAAMGKDSPSQVGFVDRPDGGDGADSDVSADNNAIGQIQGDVYLDGALLGKWMMRTLAREAGRPSAGGPSFDPRRSALPTGRMIGA